MKQEELKQQKLDKLNRLLSEIPEHEAKSVALSIKNKMDLLKVCYDKSEPHHKAKIHELIEYTQLRCFLTGEEYSNTRIRSKEIKLKDVIYSVESIKGHIKKKQLPKESSWKAIDIYSFYFGGYRAFFRCFGKVFLEKKMELDKEFIEDVFSTKEVDYYVSVKRLEIPGATIIDEEFIENIKTQSFSMIEFYTAIKDSQWLGIVHNCYVERRGYEQLKNAVLESLNQKREYKICGIVHGTGGSGKSTVLRNLCVDIQSFKDCVVTWINDVMEFCQHGISTIKQDLETNNEKKYLIVIEDWYRMLDDKPETASEFLEQLHKYNNIRIVIGDRTTVGKPYGKYGCDYNLLLSSSENREIIEQIINKYPDWQEASEKLFESLKNDEPTLFLLLFILARISQDNSDFGTVNLSDPLVVFKNIIESDLKFIAEQEEESYKGLAKALYYWSCIHAEHKIFISYETFLMIADYYNKKNTNEIGDLFNLWNADDDILDRLKLYVNKNADGEFQFNHDILAEGLSKASMKGWKKYGTKIKLELLDVITKKGDDYSTSMFLEKLLFNEPHLFTNYKERIDFIKILIEKSNNNQHYLFELTHIDLDDSDMEEIAQLIWNKKIDSVLFWSKYFQQIDNENIISKSLPQILNKESLTVYNPDFIGLVLKYAQDTKVKNDFINSILTDESKNDFPHRIVYDCLKYGKGEDVEYFFSKILNEKDWKKIDTNILKLCLKSVSLDKKREISDTVLKYTDYHFNDISFLGLCLSYSSKEAKQVYYKNSEQPDCINDHYSLYKTYFDYAPIHIKRAISDKVLQNSNIWHKANDQIIEDSIQYANKEIRIEFLLQFLKSDVDIDIIFSQSCIKYLEDPKYISQEQQEVIKQYIFDNVLYRSYWVCTITPDFVINYFNKYANDSTKQKLYRRVLKGKKWKEIEQDTLGELLKNATNAIKQNFCEKIINDNELTRIYDPILLSFFDYEIKKDAYMKFCEDTLWINFNEDSVVEGLMIFDYPSDNLYFLCLIILLKWEREIHRSNGNPFMKISRRNHILIALGHPNLKKEAKDAASGLLQKLKRNMAFEVTEEFRIIVTQIVENDIYPEWEI